MSKVFGYTKSGGKDWFVSDAYADKDIENIKDPEGGSEVGLPTAIPSPFARIDLVKTAFNNISNTQNLQHTTTDSKVEASIEDEKLVSDTLDLAELLFNIDSVKDKVRILIWDKEDELRKLKSSSSEHRRFAETLELYLQQDAKAYNFELLQRIYLIEFNHQVIGATSPVTMFFATANDMSRAQLRLTANDILFDNQYTPLYKRDIEFQKYLYLLFKTYPLLKQRMNGFNNYLEKNLKILSSTNPSLFNTINTLTSEDFYNSYSELDTGSAGSIIEVLGVALRKRKKEDFVNTVKQSDFIIDSNKYVGENKPLVLQNNFNKPFRYANDNWNNSFKVPYMETETRLERRWLPELKFQYPYLTVSDFLEPYLIKVVYPINKEKFFDGNFVAEVGDDSKGYLLPLKPQFFEFFDVADVKGTMADGKQKMEMIQGAAGSVKVILRIPVIKSREYLTFERLYYPSTEYEVSVPDEKNNKGVIVEMQLGITLFPFIRVKEQNAKAFYRMQLVDRNISGVHRNADFDLKFFGSDGHTPIPIRAKKQRSVKGTASDATTQYYVLENNFDFIQVKTIQGPAITAVLIPNWPNFTPGNKVFSFAIDFGTTNTHIEYKVDGVVRPFDITANKMQIATLFNPKTTTDDFGGTGAISIKELIVREFIPETLGVDDSNYKFPTRTASGESKALNIDTETYTLADFNIPFTYEKMHDQFNEVKSNLKWAKKEPGNEKRVKAFFEKLIMLMRNKVLLENGNLSATELIWFYPSSMKPVRKNDMEAAISKIFNEYFNPTKQPIGIAESLAPFYYYKAAGKLPGGTYSPVVSIDIGGGTTDIAIIKRNKPILLTSFKFAANSIFGDGFYEFGASSNGIVNKYLPVFEKLLETNKQYNLMKVLEAIKEKQKSDDINAFLFSLEANSKITDKNLFSYNEILGRDEQLKIIFLYFYSAIIYHIAELMHVKGIELPKHIVFSGTGSKLLNIITPNNTTLSKLSKLIFEGVYGQTFNEEGLTIAVEKQIPKEATCKGGLMTDAQDLDIDVKEIKHEFNCIQGKELERLIVDDLNDNTRTSIIEYVKNFNAFFLSLHKKINFTDYFKASPESIEMFKNEMNKHIMDYLGEGIDYNMKLDIAANKDQELEETLFFYPIIGIIRNILNQLSNEEVLHN